MLRLTQRGPIPPIVIQVFLFLAVPTLWVLLYPQLSSLLPRYVVTALPTAIVFPICWMAGCWIRRRPIPWIWASAYGITLGVVLSLEFRFLLDMKDPGGGP